MKFQQQTTVYITVSNHNKIHILIFKKLNLEMLKN